MKRIYPKLRLFVEASLQEDADILLEGEAQHYLQHVLRCRRGDEIRLFNGADGEWHARVEEVNKKGVRLALLEMLRPQPAASAPIVLAFAPIKKQRLPYLVEKAVELGASLLQPVITDYTDRVEWKTDKAFGWARKAVEQCEGMVMPELMDPLPVRQWLEGLPENEKFFFCAESGEAAPALERLAQHPVGQPACFLIGPEGGFSQDEHAYLRAAFQAVPISLGPRILRAETAVTVALGLWQNILSGKGEG